MKTLFLLLALPLAAQVVINPPALTFSADGQAATQVFMLTQRNNLTAITLNGAIDAVAVTVTVNDATNIKNGDALIIDTEAMTITAKSGKVLTVTRGDLNTTAAVHANNAPVDSLKYPSLRLFCTGVVINTVQQIMDIVSVGTVATQNAAIQTAQQIKAAAKASAVQ